MIDFTVDCRYVDDLKDDFMINEELTLYEFIGNNPVRAFYLGLHFQDWIKYIDRYQQYLYSKEVRHNKDDLEKYENQMIYWIEKYKTSDENFDKVDLAEYIINNMFWDKNTENLDRIKMAFLFGDLIANDE